MMKLELFITIILGMRCGSSVGEPNPLQELTLVYYNQSLFQTPARFDQRALHRTERAAENVLSKDSNAAPKSVSFGVTFPSVTSIRYLLFTWLSPNQTVVTHSSLSSSLSWNKSEQVKLIIPGFREEGYKKDPEEDKSSAHKIKDAYIQKNRSENIVVVDYQMFSNGPLILDSAAALEARSIGEEVADFVVGLKNNGLIQSYRDIHIIGFSLGGQIAGIAGYHIEKKSGGQKVARITGLDPVGLNFLENVSLKKRLDESDADFVDVIHCNEGNLERLEQSKFIGTSIISGHQDFYPNGGQTQEKCSDSKRAGLFGTCSHKRCYELFVQSVLRTNYTGFLCKNWEEVNEGQCSNTSSIMGEFSSERSQQGRYFLSAPPPEPKTGRTGGATRRQGSHGSVIRDMIKNENKYNKYMNDLSPQNKEWHPLLTELSKEESSGVSKTRFLLHTFEHPIGRVITKDSKLENLHWNKNEKVIVVIPGWIEKADGTFLGLASTSGSIKDAYLKMGRRENIIVVDWKFFSHDIIYFLAAKNTKIVGYSVADFLIKLVEKGYIKTYNDIHLIGFSLGGQIVGVAGNLIYKQSGGDKVARITSLDPAGPYFGEERHLDLRIDQDDANFVQIIHCNAGTLFPGGYLGTAMISGDQDFFPNSGEMQPYCVRDKVPAICSHLSCSRYFEKSIMGIKYIGCPCRSKVAFESNQCKCTASEGAVMGEFPSEGKTGIFFLETESPC